MIAQAVNPGPEEVYVAPADASSLPVKVSGTLVTGGNISWLAWSPDSAKIAMWGDTDSDGIEELYTVNTDGSVLVKVNPAIVSGDGVYNGTVAWSPDSSKLVYMADQVTPGVLLLVISAPDGTGNTVVTQPGTAEPNPGLTPAWSPDGSLIAYARIALGVNILVVNANGSDAALLDMPANVYAINNFSWAPDGSALVSMTGVQPASYTYDLYKHPTDGSPVTNITNLETDRDVKDWRWAPDSSHIAYIADLSVQAYDEAHVIKPDGTGYQKISPVTDNENDVPQGTLAWSPDSQTIIFAQDPLDTNDENIYSVARDGTGLLQLSYLVGYNVEGVVFSPDGSQVFFGDGGPGVIWVSALDGSSTVEVTDEAGVEVTDGAKAGAFQVIDGVGVSRFIEID
jgi:Tol biopolymer transport system component